MPGNQPLPPCKVAMIVALRKENNSYRAIGEKLNISKSSAEKCYKRFKTTGQFSHLKSPGQPLKWTPKTLRVIRRLWCSNPRISSQEISTVLRQYYNINLSSSRFRQLFLQKLHLRGFRPAKKPLLTAAMMKNRLIWRRKHEHWSINDWAKVLWSHESFIRQFQSYGGFVRRL